MLLTIITPTFNRAKLLSNCYESLKNQSDKDFEWLIVDDGSIDNTEEIIKEFKRENCISIRYIKKKNEGKHSALNLGFIEAKGTLSIIVDSDDILTSNAVETIRKMWNKYKNIEDLSSIVFLRGYPNGKVIGDSFPQDEFLSNHIECRVNNNIDGDKSEVYVTKILKKYRFPVFEGEKFISEGYVWLKMGKKYKAIYVNKIIYITEYLEGGLTKSGRKLRIQCPLGGIVSAKEGMGKEFILSQRVKQTLLYVSYSFFAKKNALQVINESDYKSLTLANLIPGFLLYKYWGYKYNI